MLSNEPEVKQNITDKPDKTDKTVYIPENISKYPLEVQGSIIKYIDQLTDKENIAYLIAKEHLGTSFDISKSIGYLTWKKSQVA